MKTLITTPMALCAYFCSAISIANPIYLDISDLENPIFSGQSVWYSGATQTGTEEFQLYVNVSGAHRSFPATGTSYVIFEDSEENPVLGLDLTNVSWSERYEDSTYYFDLFTVDEFGVYSGPDWSSESVTTFSDDGTWQLGYSGIQTSLNSYDIYIMGPNLSASNQTPPVEKPSTSEIPVPNTLLLLGLGIIVLVNFHLKSRLNSNVKFAESFAST